MTLRVLSTFTRLIDLISGPSTPRPLPARVPGSIERRRRTMVRDCEPEPVSRPDRLLWTSDPAEAWREFERLLREAQRSGGARLYGDHASWRDAGR